MANTSARTDTGRTDSKTRGATAPDTKSAKDSKGDRDAVLKNAVKLVVAGGGGTRKAGGRSDALALHGIRQFLDLTERNIRGIDVSVALAPGPQMREDWDAILKKLRRIGARLQVVSDAELPAESGRRGIAPKTPTGSSAKVEPVLGSNEEMIERGFLLDSQTFQNLMGWSSRQALSKAVKDSRVFYVTHKSERYFPAFYGDGAYERSHLEAVSKILGDLPGGSKLQFFVTPKRSLDGQTPLQALAAGRLAKVKDLASAFAEVPVPRS